jgi:hypothetical protein
MSDPFVIQDYSASDATALLELKHEVFGSLDLAAEQRRFDWEFTRNPACSPELPVARVVKQAKRIVASFAFVPYRMKIGSDQVLGAAGIDLMVSKDCRGQGLSRQIVAPFWAPGFCPFPFSTGLNSASQHLFTSCGGTLLGGNSETTAHAYFVEGAHPPPPAGPMDVVERVAEVPADHDSRWSQWREEHALLVERDHAYLTWRYVEFPFARPILYRSFSSRAETSGLAVLQEDPALDRLYLLELLTSAENASARRGLLATLCEHARQSGLKILYYSTRDSRQLPSLREAGFAPVPGDIPTYVACNHHRSAGRSIPVQDWAVSLGDGDQLFNVGGPTEA